MLSAQSAIIASVPSFPVTRIFAGPLRSYACSAHGGLASTVRSVISDDGVDAAFFGRPGLTSDEAATKLLSPNRFEASLAMAAINSALPLVDLPFTAINARDLIIGEANGGVLALIGHFCFLEKFREHFAQLLVFELNPGPGDLDASLIPSRLGEADVIAITGTTLINGTFESVIAHVRPDARVVMLGPSTPFAPVLFDHGVHVLCGTAVDDAELAARNASLAASPHRHEGTRQLVLEATAWAANRSGKERAC